MKSVKKWLRILFGGVLFFLIKVAPASSQVLLKVREFSNDFYGKVYIKDTSDIFSEGWTAIYDAKTDQELIKVSSDELTYLMENGAVKANVIELPYGSQSNIIYEDFNFDGFKDFAIMDGQNSCYHGPSFQVFLRKGNQFIQSQDFTDLAQNYCGMFYVDSSLKTIETMTKSGCCWHQYSLFKVKDDTPYPIEIIEIDRTGSGFTTLLKVSKLLNGQMIREEIQLIDTFKLDQKIFGLTLDNGKYMSIYYFEDQLLYFFENQKHEVELSFEGDFNWSIQHTALIFKNGDYTYFINEQGIRIERNKEKSFIPAKDFEGDLAQIHKKVWSNLKIIAE